MSPTDLSAKAQMREAVRGVRWDTTVQDADEARRMRAYVRFAERNNGGPVKGMCVTCAFRPGTEANSSAAVLEMIENAVLMGGKFNCHAGAPVDPATGCIPEGCEPHTLCRGFAAFAQNAVNPLHTLAALSVPESSSISRGKNENRCAGDYESTSPGTPARPSVGEQEPPRERSADVPQLTTPERP